MIRENTVLGLEEGLLIKKMGACGSYFQIKNLSLSRFEWTTKSAQTRVDSNSKFKLVRI